jgi:tRNA pseudouridine55 synthase
MRADEVRPEIPSGQGRALAVPRPPADAPLQDAMPDGARFPLRTAAFPGQQDGVLVLDKPGGMTSAACIARIKRVLGQRKIGHAGTLDPMARGVLLVLLGQATKLAGHMLDGGDKIYSGIIRLGIVTDTWDCAGRTLELRPAAQVSGRDLAREMAGCVGSYEQEVPPYSAAKHQGRPLYELARKGLPVPLKKKRITVSRCEAELVGPERIRFRVKCGSGTYIRSLAHSLGKRLGCGAALEELTREYSHPFGMEAAHALEDVLSAPGAFPQKVTGIADALPDWPRFRVGRSDEAAVRNGARLAYAAYPLGDRDFLPGMRALALGADGKALALAESALSGGEAVWSLLRGLWNQ